MRRRLGLVMPFFLMSASVHSRVAAAEDLSRGEAMIENYFRKQAAEISESCLKDYRTKEEWEKARPELRRQFLEMLGLWPLPAKTDLKPEITGKVETDQIHDRETGVPVVAEPLRASPFLFAQAAAEGKAAGCALRVRAWQRRQERSTAKKFPSAARCPISITPPGSRNMAMPA